MRTLRVLALILMTIGSTAYAQEKTSYFDSNWLKVLISIEVESKTDKETVYLPQGTGFLVQTPQNHTALFTAKHVVYDEQTKKVRENLVYRLNRKGKDSDTVSETQVLSLAKTGWVFSGTVDIAARLIMGKDEDDIARIPFNSILNSDPDVGANVYVIGFPLGLRSEIYSTPIVRQGIVSLVDPFLVDSFIFPGNSGGPVVYVPIIPLGKNIKTDVLQENKLIGLVTGYLPYQDVAISSQTKRPRIIFEENTGLCTVVPSKTILEFMKSDKFAEVEKNSFIGLGPVQEKKGSTPNN
ncbi:MAG TPA: hypothetical protein DCZ94_05695 [Lentisphaeria bacterium]|nr:MAG: hypothetical protein A2X48_07215 [Lentisphaerae bacterium GWF2_49_21]HBC86428.1 hypothetical protein [Lentisphaeria bacterium]